MYGGPLNVTVEVIVYSLSATLEMLLMSAQWIKISLSLTNGNVLKHSTINSVVIFVDGISETTKLHSQRT